MEKMEIWTGGPKGMTGKMDEWTRWNPGPKGPTGPKNLWDTYNITVSGGKYYVDNVERDTIYLYRDYRYRFTLDDSVSGHLLL